jgi:hypothetical protein
MNAVWSHNQKNSQQARVITGYRLPRGNPLEKGDGKMSSVAVAEDLEELKYPIGKLRLERDPSVQRLHGFLEEIRALPGQLRSTVAGLNDRQLDTPYRPGGWTVRQVCHHLPDSHMAGYIRVYWAVTEDRPTIKAYNQDAFCAMPYQTSAPVGTTLDLLDALHERWVTVMRGLTPEQWSREYIHPEDQCVYRVKDLVQIYAWHGRHHLAQINALRKRSGWCF